MKSIVNSIPVKKSRPYPKLMFNAEKNSIWLMNNSHCGTVVSKGNSLFDVSEQSTTLDANYFIDFEGSVTLSND